MQPGDANRFGPRDATEPGEWRYHWAVFATIERAPHMKTLFEPAAYQEIARRIESLQPGAARQWGKMTVSQMLEHSARALEIAAGKKRTKQALIGKTIGWIFKGGFIGEKPFGRNAPTGPEFIVSNEPDFQHARDRVTVLLKELHQLGEAGCEGTVHG